MGPDLRLPIGFMFTLVAVVLVVYGLLEPGAHSPLTNFNVNLYWGLVLLVFGALMLALGFRAQARK